MHFFYLHPVLLLTSNKLLYLKSTALRVKNIVILRKTTRLKSYRLQMALTATLHTFTLFHCNEYNSCTSYLSWISHQLNKKFHQCWWMCTDVYNREFLSPLSSYNRSTKISTLLFVSTAAMWNNRKWTCSPHLVYMF